MYCAVLCCNPFGTVFPAHALQQAVPFTGFGIMDNAIMIVAGDYIDLKLGVMLGISTMCAAGFGNIISDVAGVGLGGVIESFAERLGLPASKLTLAQMKLGACRWAAHLGTSAGLIFGCLVGMLPLLFMDPNKNEKLKRAAEREALFDGVVKEAGKLLEAEECALLVVDRQLDRLHARYKADDGAMRDAYIALSDETVTTTVARTGEVINIADVAGSSRYRKMVEHGSAYVSSVQRRARLSGYILENNS